ncbi:hypothetical protein E8E13_001897 [Curvularia kusanoi]|uniref:Uncharacterized protein n=1 Tax=Curvularia kusanoi TaxID=90978 RepID=A0A9P4T624_CURKU|nr:hypothetical protein E8E13_001897 [Curvularia kusanoi]
MTFGPEFWHACISTFSTPLNARALLTTSIGSRTDSTYEIITWTLDGSITIPFTASSTTTLSTGLAVADPIVIAWQEEDLHLFPSEYVASLVNRFNITVPLSTGSGNQSGTGGRPSGEPKSQLSTAAKAGIGLGAASAIIAIILAVALLCRRRRRKGRITATSTEQEHTKPELDGQEQHVAKKRWDAHVRGLPEADPTDLQELDSTALRAEADAQQDFSERTLQDNNVVPKESEPAELPAEELRHPNGAGRVVYPQRPGGNEPLGREEQERDGGQMRRSGDGCLRVHAGNTSAR